MHSLPSGTLTFLFTDIEGSTRRWEAGREAMAAALATHDALLRTAIETNNGYVFKTVGDAFCAAFPTALYALDAALALQRALLQQDWGEIGPIKVRAALHTGVAEERDGDYFGPPVNRVARILSAGHGGQTLLSLPTYELTRDYLPTGVELRDMGKHRLKDLARPEQLFQVLDPQIPSDFPPLKSLDYYPNNLPVNLTPLVGREKEVEAVRRQLRNPNARLLTLTGVGGTGKTRLAMQSAVEMLDEFADGVWFVDLAPITDITLVPFTVAQALKIQEAPGQSIKDRLREYFSDKKLLLVLDNFEQVVGAAPLVSEITRAAQDVKVLVTSRAVLHLYGEHEYVVPPLNLPDVHAMPTLEMLTQYEAVRLFIDRARDARPDFEVTNENAPAVAETCVRLDGLPLAIELAAARSKVLPPQEILARLQNRLKLLTGGARDLPTRQQTLRNTIEWSYYLLDEGERQLFRRLSVFVGGRTLEAIEAICNAGSDLQIDVLDGVQSLVEKSLLKQEKGMEGNARFIMLETIHEYAREKLEESGETEALRRSHAEYFLAWAEIAEPELRGPSQVQWLSKLEAEHDNLRAALQWCARNRETEIGLRLSGALWKFWDEHAYWTEGLEWLHTLLQLAPDETPTEPRSAAILAKALLGAGWLAARANQDTLRQTYTESSLQVARLSGDDALIAEALIYFGLLLSESQNPEQAKVLHESLALSRASGYKWGVAFALRQLGFMDVFSGRDLPHARMRLEESLVILRELGDTSRIGSGLWCLAVVAREEGDYETAHSLLEQSLTLAQEVGNRNRIAHFYDTMGDLSRIMSDLPGAITYYEQALKLQQELGLKGQQAMSLNNLGHALLAQGDQQSAYELFRESIAMSQEMSAEPDAFLLPLMGLGGIAASNGEAERAARLLGAVEALGEGATFLNMRAYRMDYESYTQIARMQMSEAEWGQRREEGRAMSMEQAIAYALQEIDA